MKRLARVWAFAFLMVCSSALYLGSTSVGHAQDAAFAQAVIEGLSKNKSAIAYYKANKFAPIWVGPRGNTGQRRRALVTALADADMHGLPQASYGLDKLKSMTVAFRSQRDLGLIEAAFTRAFLAYANDMYSGVLIPSRIDPSMVREVRRLSDEAHLKGFVKSSPRAYLANLQPKTQEYKGLLKAKLDLEKVLGRGGWGAKVPGKKLQPGDTGNSVVLLRNRLIEMKYLRRTNTASYDANIQRAVQEFQKDHGLNADGVAGKATLDAINTSAKERLQSVIVALERERWLHIERGRRHVLVNLADFTAKIIDNGKVTFETRAVIGKNKNDQRSPEFSDVMEHMVINPTWNVPRSIAVKEYLPMLKKNPNAVSHLNLINASGQKVDRSNVDFSQYTEKSFPFDIKQPPSKRNALGLVKYMFPNKYNIYLHDTPSKNLFNRDIRAFSHGCIRLQKPFEFGYALLAKQSGNPKAEFHKALDTGRETVIELKQHVPVHLIYRTAFATRNGHVSYRGDIYGRDGRIFSALAKQGVALRAVRG